MELLISIHMFPLFLILMNSITIHGWSFLKSIVVALAYENFSSVNLNSHLIKDEEWFKLDYVVKTWLHGILTQSLLNMILTKNCSYHTVWLSLENLFQVNKDARTIELENELRNMTLGDLTISQYCQRTKTISDLLANIENIYQRRHLLLIYSMTYLLNLITLPLSFTTETRLHLSYKLGLSY